jgi:prefoldin subunit 5
LPDINKTIEAVAMLKKRSLGEDKELETHFLVSDNIWAKAKIPNDTGKVGLWLGANVMVEYSYDDALKLLFRNQKNAEEKLAETTDDCDFLKDQITTTEVNMARVYN